MPAIASMTGYGRAEVRGERLAVTAEARSLNHRYLEVSLRLPRTLAGQEPDLRRLVQGRFARGRFDLTVAIRRLASGSGSVRVDLALAQEYLARARELARACQLDGELPLAHLLQCPGVLVVEELEEDEGEGGAPSTSLKRRSTGPVRTNRDDDGRGTTFRRADKKVGRNDPCPCGSGKKFKKCCGTVAV